MNKWTGYEPVCNGIGPSGPRCGCGGRRPVWGLNTRFAVPADHVQYLKISDVPFVRPSDSTFARRPTQRGKPGRLQRVPAMNHGLCLSGEEAGCG